MGLANAEAPRSLRIQILTNLAVAEVVVAALIAVTPCVAEEPGQDPCCQHHPCDIDAKRLKALETERLPRCGNECKRGFECMVEKWCFPSQAKLLEVGLIECVPCRYM